MDALGCAPAASTAVAAVAVAAGSPSSLAAGAVITADRFAVVYSSWLLLMLTALSLRTSLGAPKVSRPDV